MSNSKELISLAERCEKAAGPDRELDTEIAKAVGYEVEWATIGPDHRREELVQVRTYPGEFSPTSRNLRRYTASLDVAMTLIPEGMRDEIEITTLYQVARVGINLNHGPDDGPFYAENLSNSIPLALCAAALRARATQSVS